MFEPRRYFENENNRNRARRIGRNLEIFCSPKFEEIFDKLFGGLGDRVEKPRVNSIRVPDSTKADIAQVKNMRDDFHWKIDDVEDDEGLDEGDAYEDDETEKIPPSIFDMLKSGKEFKDIVSPQPKHTEIYNQAFGLDDDGNEIEPPDEDEEEDEEVQEVKNPFVFIANRLTFLIKTKLPIIFDTSIIETGINAKVNYMSIAVDVNKTFPKIETENDLAFIMREFNGSEEIQGEINEFLKDTEYDGIWAFPSTIVRNDVKIPAVRFVIYPKRKYYNFGPAFLNHNK